MSDIKGEIKLADLHGNKEACLWSLLPSEILKEIFSFISDDYLRHLRLVNRQWFNNINLNNFAIGLVRKDEFPELIQTFSRYSTLLNLNFTKTNLINKCGDEFTRLTQLQSLTHRTLAKWQHFSSLPNLRSLEVHSLTVDSLAYLTQLTRLKLSFIAGLDKGTLPSLVNLKELSLDRCEGQEAKKILANCANLKRLAMEYVYGQNDFELSLHHLTQLEEIDIDCNGTLSGLSVDSITRLDSGSRSLISSGTLQQLTNLKVLSAIEVPPNIRLMTKLESLFVDSGLEYVMDQLPLSLKSLTYNNTEIDLSDITRLTNLEQIGDIIFDEIKDFLPFMEMSHLTALSLWSTKVENFQSITLLTNLRVLDLRMEFLTNKSSLTALQYLTNLQRLSLWIKDESCFHSYDEMSFSSLCHLTSLNTSTGCKTINVSNMTQLQVLESEADRITIIGLETCTGLTCLIAPLCTDYYPNLVPLTRLRDLDLVHYDPESIDEKYLEHINSCHLTSLNIATAAVKALTRLSNLQKLYPGLLAHKNEVEDLLQKHFSYLIYLSTKGGNWARYENWDYVKH